jgi:UDP-N-acetylglucosamine 4-epimerase
MSATTMGKVLITGGAGFIGSNLAKIALQQGWNVTILDNLSAGMQATADELEHLGIKVIIGDILDQELLNKSLTGFSAVVHLAAQVSVPFSVKKPEKTIEINVKGTQNVIQSCLENDVQRLVMASSAAVYGEANNLPLKEEDAGQFLSPYADSKWANEQQIIHAREQGLQATALRFFNVYGSGQSPEGTYAAVIPKFADMMAKGVAPNINGDGLHTRDFVHVADACNAIMTLIDGEWNAEGHYVYNVATQTKTTLLDLVAEINNSLTDLIFDFKTIIPTHGPERIGDIRHSMACIKRISTTLDWTPSKSFKQGINELVIERLKLI